MDAAEAKLLTNNGMNLVTGKGVQQNIPVGLAMIQKAAEADYHEAQIAMFLWYSERNPKLAEQWFHRSQKTKPGPPGVTYSEPKSGGCAGVIVLGLVALAWAVS